MKTKSKLVNRWVLIGASIIAAAILLYIAILLAGSNYSKYAQTTPLAQITVLAAGEIPTPDIRLLEITSTPTQSETKVSNGIAIGDYVKIEGTAGSGLRIRSGPGLNTDTVFVANESDVYVVLEGPEKVDDLVWWKLTTPYDDTRQGWAAADYLSRINPE